MQSCVCRVDFEWFVGHNFRCLPASVGQIEVDLEHVVRLDGAKGVDVVLPRLLLELLARLDLQIASQKRLLFSGEHARRWHQVSE